MRPLELADYSRGYLDCLGQLTLVGEVSEELFAQRFEYMKERSDTYIPIVILNGDERIIACGTLVLERKFIHHCSILAHIEDIVVDRGERGKGLGRLLLSQLKHLARLHGAYKIVLDCSTENEAFYEKNGFSAKGLQMCLYL